MTYLVMCPCNDPINRHICVFKFYVTLFLFMYGYVLNWFSPYPWISVFFEIDIRGSSLIGFLSELVYSFSSLKLATSELSFWCANLCYFLLYVLTPYVLIFYFPVIFLPYSWPKSFSISYCPWAWEKLVFFFKKSAGILTGIGSKVQINLGNTALNPPTRNI